MTEVEALKDDCISVLTDVAQLMDGWHQDSAWTDWDESVRKRVGELLKQFYEPPKQKCPKCSGINIRLSHSTVLSTTYFCSDCKEHFYI